MDRRGQHEQWHRWCDINTASRHQMAPRLSSGFHHRPCLSSARPQYTTMVGKYLLWLSRSQHTLVSRHLDLEYGSFVSGVSPPSSHAGDPGDRGGGGGNVNVSQCIPVSTQYSAQCLFVVLDVPDGACPPPEMLHVLYSLLLELGCVWCPGPGVQRGVSFLYNFMML